MDAYRPALEKAARLALDYLESLPVHYGYPIAHPAITPKSPRASMVPPA